MDNLVKKLVAMKSAETTAIRIYRTGLKSWQKSGQLRSQITKYGEPADKWARITKTMDLRTHQ